jgi:uncharacterized protein (DUF58 family)
VTPVATDKLVRLIALAALAALAGLVLGRPDLLALAAPLVVAAAIGVAAGPPAPVTVAVERVDERCVEGEAVRVRLELCADSAVEELEVGLVVPPGLERRDGTTRAALALRPGEPVVLEAALQADRWGAYGVGEVALRAYGPGRLLAWDEVLDQRGPVRVFPRPERLAAALRPHATHLFAGNHRARAVGDGIEFASVRPFVAGDAIRRVNWRVTSRRGALHTNEHHLERNADVVLFLDVFGEAGPAGESSLDRSVRGAATLARHALRSKDRVGLVGFGGTVSWVHAGMGEVQLLRLLLALIDLHVAHSYAWKAVDVLPRRALPPRALVVALSPLADPRAVHALLDLRARGFAVSVLDTLDPDSVPAGPGERGALAHRLWRLGREELHRRFEELGVPVVPYGAGDDLAAALVRLPPPALRRAYAGRPR